MRKITLKMGFCILAMALLFSAMMIQQAVAQVAGRVVVATSGGDYTTVSAALAAINPTASNPYIIDVMPGTYVDNFTMKSYVHLRGAGSDVTIIQSTSTDTILVTVSSATNVTISGLTLKQGRQGIYITEASPTIHSNTIMTSTFSGIFIDGNSSPVIRDNTISGNGDAGIIHQPSGSSSPFIIGNTITGNTNYGIFYWSGSNASTIRENKITGNGPRGIHITNGNSPRVLYNQITGHSITDIGVGSSSNPNISFNVYDIGPTIFGSYNVKSDGTPIN